MTDVTSYLGFANLPNQVQRKFAKKGFEFNLMVVGESGLGKTTLINSLFMININSDRKVPLTNDLLNKTLSIQTNSVDIEERGVRLKLTVIDTPGFGDALNCSNNYDPILNYIDEQYENYLSHESGLNRRQIHDTRVHCCFYFISPLNYGLKPADLRFLKLLQHKVNVIPLIAKSDFLTPNESEVLKRKIMEEIKANQIQIYTIPDCDTDDEIDYKEHVEQLKNSFPFAVSSSLEFHEVKGRKVRGREYGWGIVETENPDHTDYVKLRSMLVSHMQDLREVTHDIHYENYRSQRLAAGNIMPSKISIDNMRDNVSILSGCTSVGEEIVEKNRLIEEQNAEIRKMKEIINRIKEEMRQKSMNTSLNDSGNFNGNDTFENGSLVKTNGKN